MYISRFCCLYKLAFDDDGHTKTCGREMCKEIMVLANQIEPTVSHGNIETGFMDISSIQALYERLNP